MTESIQPNGSKMQPLLILVIVSCFGRAVWGIASIVPLLRYVLDGRISSPWFLYVLAAESLLWLIIGVGLWRLAPAFRLAAIALAGIAVLLGGRGLILMMMHQASSPTSYALVIGFLILDFFVIWYLSQPAVKSLFEKPAPSAAPAVIQG